VKARRDSIDGGGSTFPARRSLSLLTAAGPAVIASIAYVDPGNIATNIQAGARHGTHLLVVVLAANIIAMLFQSLSAKLGIATGRNLAELGRDHFAKPLVYAMWAISELAAIATDLAELLGGAIGFSLLFGVSLLGGMAICASAAYGLLLLQRRGPRPLELVTGGFIAVIGISYVAQIALAGSRWRIAAGDGFLPHLGGHDAIMLTVALIGATVMPHVIYLHSALTQARLVPGDETARRRLVRLSNQEVILALGVAGIINMAMVVMAAAAFHDGVHDGVADIANAYRTLLRVAGGGVAALFLASLIASGLSSSTVGTMAGQIIMQGFSTVRIPLWLRRLATLLPAFAVIAGNVNATSAMVLSQVVLSLALPVPVVALIVFTSRRSLMGDLVNGRWTSIAAIAAAIVLLALNLLLAMDAAGVSLPPGAWR
jgi:manganese transport protein